MHRWQEEAAITSSTMEEKVVSNKAERCTRTFWGCLRKISLIPCSASKEKRKQQQQQQ